MRAMKHWAIAAMTATALALAGCGGGGSSTAGGPPVEPGPTPAQTEHMAISSAVAAAETAVDGLSATSTDADVAVANAAITMAQNALDAAEHILSAQALELDDELDGIRVSLTMAEGTIAEHRKMVADAEAARVAAATESAGTKLAAITAEAAQTTDGSVGGSDIATAHVIAISRGRDGTEVTITVDSPPDGAPEFVQAMDLGGGTTMHTRTMDADADRNVVQEVVIVTTDIDPPKATAFATVYPLDTSTDTTNDDPDGGTATNESLVIDETSADVRGRVMASAFTAGTGAILTFDAADTDEEVDAFEAPGTYDGAMGVYLCNGSSDCTVTLNADGMITAMSTGWVFTPDEGATSDVADTEYVSYGFWLQRTTDSDGAVTYDEVETFADATGLDASSGTITGTASYSGGATGVYVHHVYSAGGGSTESSTAGHFTADASLMAYFGQTVAADLGGEGQIAPNMLNSLTGTIDNFMLSGGEANDWSVELGVESSGTAITDAAGFSGTAKGGVGDGSLSGTFRGAADMLPDAMIGEFNAGFSNGAVAGAFGAMKD